jgi:hypothetical protein
MPVTPASASVQVQTSTESSFAVSGTKCFDINSSNETWRTAADFSKEYTYNLSGTLGSGATITAINWSYTNPNNAVEVFTPATTNTTTITSNQVTVKYNPALLSDATIGITGIVVMITAAITTENTTGCPNATFMVSIPVKIRNATCYCPGVLIPGGVHTGPDTRVYYGSTGYNNFIGFSEFRRIASQDLCVYYRDALNGSTEQFSWNEASSANGCAGTTGGTYVDAVHASMGWRLPNIAELGYLSTLSTPTYDNLATAPNAYPGTTNMRTEYYWSRTETDSVNDAYTWAFLLSLAWNSDKADYAYVRCVRNNF